MALETVSLVVDKNWSLLSNTTGGLFEADVVAGSALLSIGAAAPASDSGLGRAARSYRYTALDGKVWARAVGDAYATLALTRVVDAANAAPVVLPAATLSASSFAAGAVAGTEIATIDTKLSGAVVDRISPADGRVVLSADRMKLLRGLSAVSAGDIEVSIYTTHPLAPDNPHRTKIKLNVTDAFAAPPSDWRAVPLAAYSVDPAAPALMMADQATPATKTRNGVVNLANGSAAGMLFAYRLPSNRATDWLMIWGRSTATGPSFVVETSTDTTNGIDGTWASLATYTGAIGSGVDNNNAARIPAALGGSSPIAVRLRTIQAAASNIVYRPRLYAKPASGAWDCVAYVGASRENGQSNRATEEAIIAKFPGRDPVVLNASIGGQTSGGLVTNLANVWPRLKGVSCYAKLGSLLGNDCTNDRPYTSAQFDALTANIESIVSALVANEQIIIAGNNSFRIYSGGASQTTAASQEGGSLPYNDNVMHPKMNDPRIVGRNAKYLRPEIDEYSHTLRRRDTLTDGIHSTGDQYAGVISFNADAVWTWIYTGSWGKPEIERIVEAAEANPSAQSQNGVSLKQEALYAVSALAATAGKAALQARLALLP